MLADLKSKSLQTAASLKDATQKGAESLSSKAKTTADSLNIKIPAVLSGSAKNGKSNDADTVPTESESKDQEEEGLLDEFTQQCKLTKRQRLYGAIGCYVVGAICSFFSTMALLSGPWHIKQFAFFYTVGTLSSIGSSLFLVGPKTQCKVMCQPVRRVACCIWIGAMFCTLILAIGFPRAAPLVLLLVIIQYAAMLWYGASFIPYGRTILKKCCAKATNAAMSV